MASIANCQKKDLHDALSGHRVCLFIDALDIPERDFLVFIVGTDGDRDYVELKPKARAQGGAHVLESGGETSTNKLGKVLRLVLLGSRDDVVGDNILSHLQGIIKNKVLDREVDQVGRIMDGHGNNRRVVVGEDSRDTQV